MLLTVHYAFIDNGRWIVIVLPFPVPALVAVTVPPCNSTSLLTKCNPIPNPFVLASGSALI